MDYNLLADDDLVNIFNDNVEVGMEDFINHALSLYWYIKGSKIDLH